MRLSSLLAVATWTATFASWLCWDINKLPLMKPERIYPFRLSEDLERGGVPAVTMCGPDSRSVFLQLQGSGGVGGGEWAPTNCLVLIHELVYWPALWQHRGGGWGGGSLYARGEPALSADSAALISCWEPLSLPAGFQKGLLAAFSSLTSGLCPVQPGLEAHRSRCRFQRLPAEAWLSGGCRRQTRRGGGPSPCHGAVWVTPDFSWGARGCWEERKAVGQSHSGGRDEWQTPWPLSKDRCKGLVPRAREPARRCPWLPCPPSGDAGEPATCQDRPRGWSHGGQRGCSGGPCCHRLSSRCQKRRSHTVVCTLGSRGASLPAG